MGAGRALGAALLAWLAAGAAEARCSQGDGAWIREACYEAPLTQGLYGHDILGGTPEWTRIRIALGPQGQAAFPQAGTEATMALPAGHIYEDTAPRIADLSGDGRPEIIAVVTSFQQGAALAVIGLDPRDSAQSPYIGRPNRWLAPIGAADLDGDGQTEIAWIDRPHLAKTLRIFRYHPAQGSAPATLRLVAEAPGLSNHRIGWPMIPGGIRTCGGHPEMITADATYTNIIASRLQDGRIISTARGPYTGPDSLTQALTCPG